MSHDSKSNSQDPVAAFLAKGGKIQNIEPGVRSLSEGEVYAKASGRDDLAGDSYTDSRMREAENQTVLEQHHPYYR
ncbi:hypothetical protein [Microbulbifer epialgicus]|uniref:Transcriptional regulator SutA RNAP-binding domain-containing protein n=1 Tax=Microbulbifer epialgicus TaxID=393907 RepID=A0ABV4NTS0_9GAMM